MFCLLGSLIACSRASTERRTLQRWISRSVSSSISRDHRGCRPLKPSGSMSKSPRCIRRCLTVVLPAPGKPIKNKTRGRVRPRCASDGAALSSRRRRCASLWRLACGEPRCRSVRPSDPRPRPMLRLMLSEAMGWLPAPSSASGEAQRSRSGRGDLERPGPEGRAAPATSSILERLASARPALPLRRGLHGETARLRLWVGAPRASGEWRGEAARLPGRLAGEAMRARACKARAATIASDTHPWET